MADNRIKSNLSVSKTGGDYQKRWLFTAMLWLLFAVALLSTFFAGIISITLFILISLGIWKLSRYWGKKFDAVMFPKPLSDRVKSSKFYQLYFVEAMKQQWSALLLLLNIFPFLLILLTFLDFLNPVLDLSDMKKYHGIVKHVHRAPVTRGGYDYMWLESQDGTNVKATISLGPGDYEYLKKLTRGDKVTIWVQKKWDFPPSIRVEHVRQLLHREHYLTRYSKVRVEKVTLFSKLVFYLSLAWILFTLVLIKIKYKEHV